MNPREASEILKEGTLISTKLASTNTWDSNIVYSCSENYIYISLLESYLNKPVFVGTRILLKHTSDLYEYHFEGCVKEINAKFPQKIGIKVIKACELLNTRKSIRYDTCIAANISSVESGLPEFCVVSNLSLGGVAIVCKKKFDYGEDVLLECTIGDKINFLTKGRIIRRKIKATHIEYSLHFIDVNEENQRVLKDYINSIENKLLLFKEVNLKKMKLRGGA